MTALLEYFDGSMTIYIMICIFEGALPSTFVVASLALTFLCLRWISDGCLLLEIHQIRQYFSMSKFCAVWYDIILHCIHSYVYRKFYIMASLLRMYIAS